MANIQSYVRIINRFVYIILTMLDVKAVCAHCDRHAAQWSVVRFARRAAQHIDPRDTTITCHITQLTNSWLRRRRAYEP